MTEGISLPASANQLVPKRSMRTLRELPYCEVTEQELSQLEKSFKDAKNSTGFASVAFGVFVSCATTLCSVDYTTDPKKFTILLVFAVVGGVAAMAKAITAYGEQQEFEKVMKQVREEAKSTSEHQGK
jgi:hypothetical protein